MAIERELTKEEERILNEEIRPKWEKFALWSGSELKPEVAEHVNFLYQRDGYPAPITILTGSPYGAQVASNYLNNPQRVRELARNDQFIANVILDVDKQLAALNVKLPEGGL